MLIIIVFSFNMHKIELFLCDINLDFIIFSFLKLMFLNDYNSFQSINIEN